MVGRWTKFVTVIY